MTEDYVRNVDTTYNLVARRFLPPHETRKQWWIRQTLNEKARIGEAHWWLQAVGMRAYILTKLVAFSVLTDRVFPNASLHLGLFHAARAGRITAARGLRA